MLKIPRLLLQRIAPARIGIGDQLVRRARQLAQPPRQSFIADADADADADEVDPRPDRWQPNVDDHQRILVDRRRLAGVAGLGVTRSSNNEQTGACSTTRLRPRRTKQPLS